MFKAKTNVGMLVECIEAITGVVDDGVVNITKDGWDIRVVDPANVAMVSLKLQSGIFDSFEFEAPKGEDRLKIGINFANLLEMLELWEESSAVELELDEKAETLFVRSSIFDYSVPLIEPSSLRRAPNLPKPTFLAPVIIEAERFTKSIRALGRVSDRVTIGINAEELYMWAEEGWENLRVVLGKHPILKDEPDISSIHSLEYLSEMCNGMTHAKELTLFQNKDYPIQIDFNIANNRGEVSYLLAPRIRPEED